MNREEYDKRFLEIITTGFTCYISHESDGYYLVSSNGDKLKMVVDED